MPAPDPSYLLRSEQEVMIGVSLEPAQNALYSLLLLVRGQEDDGLDDWVKRAMDSLSPKQRRVNRLVTVGLFYAINPVRSYPSFLAYVDDLAAQDPLVLRDRILATYMQMPLLSEADPETWALCSAMRIDPSEVLKDMQPEPLLEDVRSFLDFLRMRFHSVDPDIEKEAHEYLNNPVAMQDLIVAHMRDMWDVLLAEEWQRKMPTLQACVTAFQRIDFSHMTNVEAAEMVLGHHMKERYKLLLENTERVVFVPSMHVGTYPGKFRNEKMMWMMFTPHMPNIPQAALYMSPELMRSELLVRLRGLTDDTRLQILRLLAEEGEMCSRDIIEQLDLSQSAASRHLTQLSATGYLAERRREGAKCYSLNQERVEDTCHTLRQYLLTP